MNKKEYKQFLNQVNEILNTNFDFNYNRIEKDTVFGKVNISIWEYDNKSKVWSIFIRFENGELANDLFSCGNNGKCNIHEFESEDCIYELKEFYNKLKNILL